MSTDIMSIFCNHSQQVGITVNIPSHDEKIAWCMMFSENIEQTVHRLVAAPVIKAKENGIIGNSL